MSANARSVTPFPIRLINDDNLPTGIEYRCTVRYMEEGEWNEIIGPILLKYMKNKHEKELHYEDKEDLPEEDNSEEDTIDESDDDESNDDVPNDTLLSTVVKKIYAKSISDFTVDMIEKLSALTITEEASHILRNDHTVSLQTDCKDVKSLSNFMTSIKKDPLHVLVEEVEIRGQFDFLQNDIQLLDVPGSKDENEIRSVRFQNAMTLCAKDGKALIVNCARDLNNSNLKDLVKNILQEVPNNRLVHECISMVATMMDQTYDDLTKMLTERDLKERQTMDDLKLRKLHHWKKNAKSNFKETMKILKKEKKWTTTPKLYFTSADAELGMKTFPQEENEITKIKHFIKKTASDRAMKMKEINDILLALVEEIKSDSKTSIENEHIRTLFENRSTEAQKAITDMINELEKVKGIMITIVSDIVQPELKKASVNVNAVVSKAKKEHHEVFRAAVNRLGKYGSFDLNECIAENFIAIRWDDLLKEVIEVFETKFENICSMYFAPYLISMKEEDRVIKDTFQRLSRSVSKSERNVLLDISLEVPEKAKVEAQEILRQFYEKWRGTGKYSGYRDDMVHQLREALTYASDVMQQNLLDHVQLLVQEVVDSVIDITKKAKAQLLTRHYHLCMEVSNSNILETQTFIKSLSSARLKDLFNGDLQFTVDTNVQVIQPPPVNTDDIVVEMRYRTRAQTASVYVFSRSKLSITERRHTFNKTRSPNERQNVLEAGQCVACETVINWYGVWHVDHIVPLSLGGHNSVDNFIPLCASCNLSKGNMFMEKFIERRRETNKNFGKTFEKLWKK